MFSDAAQVAKLQRLTAENIDISAADIAAWQRAWFGVSIFLLFSCFLLIPFLFDYCISFAMVHQENGIGVTVEALFWLDPDESRSIERNNTWWMDFTLFLSGFLNEFLFFCFKFNNAIILQFSNFSNSVSLFNSSTTILSPMNCRQSNIPSWTS